MSAVILPFEFYNSIYFDCVKNSVMSILNKVIGRTDCLFLPYNYRVNNNSQFELFVSMEELNSYFEIKKIDLKTDFHDSIRHYINDNNYLFISVDCFYYPFGRFHKKDHHIHPTCIYGYDDINKVYIVNEDITKHGAFNKTLIPYDDFYNAYLAAKCKGSELFYEAYQVKKNERNESDLTIKLFIPSIKKIIEGSNHSEDSELNTLFVGMNALKYYIDNIRECLISDFKNIKEYEYLAYRISNIHKQNHLSFEYIFKESENSKPAFYEIQNAYIMLQKRWGNIRNLLIKYSFTGKEETLNSIIKFMYQSYLEELETHKKNYYNSNF